MKRLGKLLIVGMLVVGAPMFAGQEKPVPRVAAPARTIELTAAEQKDLLIRSIQRQLLEDQITFARQQQDKLDADAKAAIVEAHKVDLKVFDLDLLNARFVRMEFFVKNPLTGRYEEKPQGAVKK